MAVDLAGYAAKARTAVKLFWDARSAAGEKQLRSGKVDQGERAGVTAGKNMQGFATIVDDIVRSNGLTNARILKERRALTLPGYFRPTKVWDVLVLHEGRLIAALEFKSHVGPSFGNNFNNRAEEAIGNAVDLWTAYREGAFGDCPRPFVGWLMLLEDCHEAKKPVTSVSPNFPVLRV